MTLLRKIMCIFGKALATLLLLVAMVFIASSVSPIYDFRAPRPFSGPDIFNPYRDLDTTLHWKRANFHTHTRVKGLLNECEVWPKDTYDTLRRFGYDIITFSNHNEITPHPVDPALQVNVYEHGYSVVKFHKLVFGSRKVKHYDALAPFLISQKQFQLDYLGKGSDFIQMNHPYRVLWTRKSHLEALSGYEIMELDSGKGTENEYWDWALSAGHYSFGLANDDLHFPYKTYKTAVRCNFLQCPSERYEDIRETLLGGCYYAMRIPDYGHGDWKVKHEKNRHLPYVRNIGLTDSTVFIRLSVPADSIRLIGQDHRTLARAECCDNLSYTMLPEDSYGRFTAWFPEGEVIYSNPFARYDASVAATPADNTPQKVNIPLTILYNLLVMLVFAGAVTLLCLLFIKKK